MSRFAQPILLLAAGVLSPPFLNAQSVWVVDAGGGGHAIDIHFAVTMAADGDVVLVRPGVYTGTFLPGNKSLTLVGQPGVEVRVGLDEGGFVLRDLQAGKRVSIRGFHIRQRASGNGESGLYFSNNRGTIHLEDIVVDSMEVSTLDIHGSVAVTAVNVSLQGARMLNVHVTRSSVVMVNCSCVSSTASFPALIAEASRVSLADCTFRASAPGAEGAVFFNASVAIAGRGSGGYFAAPGALSASAIRLGNGDLTIDPSIPLGPNGMAAPISNSGGTLVSRSIHTLLLDAQGTCTLSGPSRAASVTFVTLPAAPTGTPLGTVWGDLASLLPIDQGLLGSVPRRIPLPPGRGTLGRPLLLQSALVDAAGQLSLSTPLPFTY